MTTKRIPIGQGAPGNNMKLKNAIRKNAVRKGPRMKLVNHMAQVGERFGGSWVMEWVVFFHVVFPDGFFGGGGGGVNVYCYSMRAPDLLSEYLYASANLRWEYEQIWNVHFLESC